MSHDSTLGPLGSPLRWHHIALTVADADASAKWYEEKVGFHTALRIQRPEGTVIIFIEAGSLRIELIGRTQSADDPKAFAEFDQVGAVRGYAHASIVVDDCVAVAGELERRGVRVSDRRPTGTDEATLARIRQMTVAARWFWDLDGNLFQLCQEPDR